MKKITTLKNMMTPTVMFMFVMVWLFAVPHSGAEFTRDPIVVIVNAQNPVQSLTIKEVRMYYENNLLNWPNGQKVVLYDFNYDGNAPKAFYTRLLNKDSWRIASERAWRKLTNTAKNPPRLVYSATVLQNRVANDPRAMGYILKSDLRNENVRVVATIN